MKKCIILATLVVALACCSACAIKDDNPQEDDARTSSIISSEQNVISSDATSPPSLTHIDGIDGYSLESLGLAVNPDIIDSMSQDGNGFRVFVSHQGNIKGYSSGINDDNLNGEMTMLMALLSYGQAYLDGFAIAPGMPVDFMVLQGFKRSEVDGNSISINYELYSQAELDEYIVYTDNDLVVYDFLPLTTNYEYRDFFYRQCEINLDEFTTVVPESDVDWFIDTRKMLLERDDLIVKS